MTEFEITYGFNCRRFLREKVEAETIEEAYELARKQARAKIETECVALQNTADYGDTELWDAYVYVDATDPALDMDSLEGEMPELDKG